MAKWASNAQKRPQDFSILKIILIESKLLLVKNIMKQVALGCIKMINWSDTEARTSHRKPLP